MATMTDTTTKPATTDDQKKVLRVADAHPDASPKEIAAMIDDGAIKPPYVTQILDGFHLPEDRDRPESEAGRRLDGISADGGDTIHVPSPDFVTVDHWKCALCGESRPDGLSVRQHIVQSGDDAHSGRGSDDTHLVEPVGENTAVLERLAEAGGYAPITEAHLRAAWMVYFDDGSTTGAIADELGVAHGTILNRLHNLGVGTPGGGSGGSARDHSEWVAAIDAVLDAANIEFAPDAADVGEQPDVLSLQPGDTAEQTVVGGWYEGTVNNVPGDVLFVTLAKAPSGDRRGNLRGRVKEMHVPSPYVPGDYDEGDSVVVERLAGSEGGQKLDLRLVTDPDGGIVADGPYVPPGEAGGGGRVRRENETGSYEGPAEGVDMTMTHISEAQDADGGGAEEGEGDENGGEPYYGDERIDAYEEYWKWVDKTRWLGRKLGRSQASKFDSENSPLARAYNEAMGTKHDFREGCMDLPGNLPAYRRHFEEPAWDYRTEEPRKEGDGQVYLPADFETPDVWDEATFDDIGGDPAVEMIEEIEKRIEEVAEMVEASHRGSTDFHKKLEERIDGGTDVEEFEHLHNRHDVIQQAIGCADGGPDETKFETLQTQLAAIEAAVTGRDTRESGKPFTLHLSADELKLLVKEAPDEVADVALDALAEGAQ